MFDNSTKNSIQNVNSYKNVFLSVPPGILASNYKFPAMPE